MLKSMRKHSFQIEDVEEGSMAALSCPILAASRRVPPTADVLAARPERVRKSWRLLQGSLMCCRDNHTEEGMAKAYWVVCYRSLSDPAARTEYAKLARPAVLAGGGRYLALGRPA